MSHFNTIYLGKLSFKERFWSNSRLMQTMFTCIRLSETYKKCWTIYTYLTQLLKAFTQQDYAIVKQIEILLLWKLL